MRVLRNIRFDRLKKLANLNRRSSIAATTASAAVLLMVFGVVFASQGGNTPQPINQAASLFHPASPSNSNTNNKSTTPAPSDSTGAPGSQPLDTSLPTPTTILGPNGETIVVPPLTTKPSTTPVPNTGSGTTAPAAVSTPTTAPTTSATTPLATTPTTVAPRPTSSNGASLPTASVSVVSSSPEDPTVNLRVVGADSDGYVSSIVIDWNDGTTQSIQSYSLLSCVDPESSSHTWQPSHDYDTAGSYNISVTVTSINCANDNSDSQQALAASSVVTGGTSTPPDTVAP